MPEDPRRGRGRKQSGPLRGPRRDDATYEGLSEPTPGEKVRPYLEYAPFIVVAIIVALIVKAVALQAFFIPSESMEPLLTGQDRVLVNKLAYKFGDIKRGDVVVVKRPPGLQDPTISHLIKRVIAKEGDTVEAVDGVLVVNGIEQDEPYLLEGSTTENLPKTTVPKGGLWLMGDNRNNSGDSREPEIGAVSTSLVVGRADFIIWPLNRIRHIDSQNGDP